MNCSPLLSHASLAYQMDVRNLAAVIYTIYFDWDLKVAYTWMAGSRFLLLLALEFLSPLKDDWRITKYSFFRDAKLMALGVLVSRGIRFLLVLAAIDLSHCVVGRAKRHREENQALRYGLGQRDSFA